MGSAHHNLSVCVIVPALKFEPRRMGSAHHNLSVCVIVPALKFEPRRMGSAHHNLSACVISQALKFEVARLKIFGINGLLGFLWAEPILRYFVYLKGLGLLMGFPCLAVLKFIDANF